jgi:site-specific recombinase XerD
MSSELRTRFTNYLTVLRRSEATKESYLRAVRDLAAYYQRPPDQLDDDQIQEYLRHLIEDRKLEWNTCNVHFSGLVSFYHGFLKWDEVKFTVPPRPRILKLPLILSVEEVRRLIDATTNLKHRALLMTVYCGGLRVSEVVNLKKGDIESDPSRMMIRIDQGKGKKDRYTILTTDCLETLRQYYRAFQPYGEWLFPGINPFNHLSKASAQHIYYDTKKKPA